MRSKHIARQLLDVEAIARRAEAIPGVMVYASYLPEAYLIRLTNEEVLVVTGRNGYLRLRAKDIRPLIEELENILEDMKYEHE